jgi:hypothetical protein
MARAKGLSTRLLIKEMRDTRIPQFFTAKQSRGEEDNTAESRFDRMHDFLNKPTRRAKQDLIGFSPGVIFQPKPGLSPR